MDRMITTYLRYTLGDVVSIWAPNDSVILSAPVTTSNGLYEYEVWPTGLVEQFSLGIGWVPHYSPGGVYRLRLNPQMEYGRPRACPHSSLVDTGMRISFCRACDVRLEWDAASWKWVAT